MNRCQVTGCYQAASIISADREGHPWLVCSDCYLQGKLPFVGVVKTPRGGHRATRVSDPMSDYLRLAPPPRRRTRWEYVIPSGVAYALGLAGMAFGPFWWGVAFTVVGVVLYAKR